MTALLPASLLSRYETLFTAGASVPGPVLDLACGEGRNGVFLATRGLEVICCDRSEEMLESARRLAEGQGVRVTLWRVDLEARGESPLPPEAYGAILVFRYLHRPLMESIRKALRPGGILMYETFTVEQRRFGKPRSPDHLLQPGELGKWFGDWERIYRFEGTLADPERAVAQLVCRKPA